MTPTKQAVEAARERLAKAAEAAEQYVLAKMFRAGRYDDAYELQALAIALQEMSDAVKACGIGVCHPLYDFALPNPVDPLKTAMRTVGCSNHYNVLSHELAKRGLQIVAVQS